MNNIPSWTAIKKLLELNFDISLYEQEEANGYGVFKVDHLDIGNFIFQLREASKDYKTEIRRIKESSKIAVFEFDFKTIKLYLKKYQKNIKSLEELKKEYPFETDRIYGHYPPLHYEIVNNYKKHLGLVEDIAKNTTVMYNFITRLNGHKLSFNIDVKNKDNLTKLKLIYKGLKEHQYLNATEKEFIKEMSSMNSFHSLDWKQSNVTLKYFLRKLLYEFSVIPSKGYLIIGEAIFTVKGKILKDDTLTNTKGKSESHENCIDTIF